METRQSDQKPQKILVVDDHEAVLSGVVNILKKHYPATEIVTAQTVMSAQQQLEHTQPDLMLTDLSIPKSPGDMAQTENGIQFLRQSMQQYATLNIVVQSSHAKALVRLKPAINAHEGGFTIADKSLPVQEMLIRVNWALQGVVCTPREMRTGLELKHEWVQVLRLAF
ncbi:MAG: response regulator transcription factor, partial [Pseudanabaenales cyanobacterium]|nr:response regulator transcription factor [Pseudanabaenales cyanobacterium]